MDLSQRFARTMEYLGGRWYERTPRTVSLPVPQITECCGDGEVPAAVFNTREGLTLDDLTEGMEWLTPAEIKRRLNANIPNEREQQVIEVCSGTGIDFGYGFAKRHPVAQVDLVGITTGEEIGPWMFRDGMIERFRMQHGEHAEAAVRELLARTGNEPYDSSADWHGEPAAVLQRAFMANDRGNMRYIERNLLTRNALSEVFDPFKSNTVIGFRCPGPVASTVFGQALAEGAEAIMLTNSAVATADPGVHFPLSDAAKFRKAEYRNMMELLYDPHAANSTGEVQFKLAYQKPEHRNLGFALKQLRALDMILCLQEHGYHTRAIGIPLEPNATVNAAEHVIYGFKRDDILAPVVQPARSR